jgi:hypothetical protein
MVCSLSGNVLPVKGQHQSNYDLSWVIMGGDPMCFEALLIGLSNKLVVEGIG